MQTWTVSRFEREMFLPGGASDCSGSAGDSSCCVGTPSHVVDNRRGGSSSRARLSALLANSVDGHTMRRKCDWTKRLRRGMGKRRAEKRPGPQRIARPSGFSHRLRDEKSLIYLSKQTVMPPCGTQPHENGDGRDYSGRSPALGVRPSLSLVSLARKQTWSRPRLDVTSNPTLSPPGLRGSTKRKLLHLRGRPTGSDSSQVRRDCDGNAS